MRTASVLASCAWLAFGCGGKEGGGPVAEVHAEAGLTTGDAGRNETDSTSVESDAPTADAGTDVSAESEVANAADAIPGPLIWLQVMVSGVCGFSSLTLPFKFILLVCGLAG